MLGFLSASTTCVSIFAILLSTRTSSMITIKLKNCFTFASKQYQAVRATAGL
jgi:hypothetical protein